MKTYHSAYFCCFCDKISFDSAMEAKNHIVQVRLVTRAPGEISLMFGGGFVLPNPRTFFCFPEMARLGLFII